MRPAIRGERGQILSHGGCWHGAVYHEGFSRDNCNVGKSGSELTFVTNCQYLP